MPLFFLSFTFLLGIILSVIMPSEWSSIVLIAGVLFLLFLIERWSQKKFPDFKSFRQKIPVSTVTLFIIFSVGILRYQVTLLSPGETSLAYYNDRGEYQITAWVSAPPDRRESGVYLELKAVDIMDPLECDPASVFKRVSGKARLHLPVDAPWDYGDMLRFKATPQTPGEDDDFSYKKYLSRQGIDTVIYNPAQVELVDVQQGNPLRQLLEDLRQSAKQVIFNQLPMPESSLLSGILLGLDNDLPSSLERAYRDTGTAHIIAISGFNMAILAGLFMFLFSRLFSLHWATLVTALVLISYTTLVGGAPSVVRAAIMAVMAFGGHLIGRRQASQNALWFTAAVMCLVNPGLITDAGFQLSFAATLGLVVFGRSLQQWAERTAEAIFGNSRGRKAAEMISQYFLFTLAAQVTTLPVIALQFGRISVSTLVSNPLILPFQPALLILGGIATILGMVIPLLGKVAAMLAWPLLAYTNNVVIELAKLKGGSLIIHPHTAWLILVFVIVACLLFIFRHFFTKILGRYFPWLVLVLTIAATSIWSIAIHQPDGRAHLVLQRAGSSSVLTIHTPDGKILLFDPGEEYNEISAAISRDLSPWDFNIDEVWLTNRSSARQLSSLNERLPIRKIILTPPLFESVATQNPVTLPADIVHTKLLLGDTEQYWSGFLVSVLATDTENAALLLSWKDTSVLIPNGVDYARIRERSPDALEGLTVIVLREDDIRYIPPRVWQQLQPQVILWNSMSISPEMTWHGVDQYEKISVISNGDSTCNYLEDKSTQEIGSLVLLCGSQ